MFRALANIAAALAEHLGVEPNQVVAYADVELGVREVAVLGSAEFVGRAVLVDEPGDLVRMSGEVGRKFRGDEQVDWLAVRFAQIEQAPGGGVRQNLFLRVPLERHAHEFREEPAEAQLPHQLPDVNLGAAVHEWNLRLADNDSPNGHFPPHLTTAQPLLAFGRTRSDVLASGGKSRNRNTLNRRKRPGSLQLRPPS